MSAADLIRDQLLQKNKASVIREQAFLARIAAGKEIDVEQVSELASGDLGDFNAGSLSVADGVVTLGENGLAVVTSGGDMSVDMAGITTEGLNYFQRFHAVNAGNDRTLELGTLLPTGSAIPAGYFAFYSPAGANLQTGGDFETGDLSDGWTTGGNGTWSADTEKPHAGSYAAKLALSDSIVSNLQTNGYFGTGNLNDWTTGGTGTWSCVAGSTLADGNPPGGLYAAALVGTAGQTGTLTTNLGATPRIAVTAGLDYPINLFASYVPGYWTTAQVLIKWYTATSGGSLVSTTTINLVQYTTPGWDQTTQVITAPATSAGAEVVLNCARDGSAGSRTIAIGSISFGEAQNGTLTTNLGAIPRMAVTAGAVYQANIYSQKDAAVTFDISQAVVNWYTATSGGSLVSTTTVPISLTSEYGNIARALTVPATAAGAEFVFTFECSGAEFGVAVNIYLDDISLKPLTVIRQIEWLPDPTVKGGGWGSEEQSAAPDAPGTGYVLVYADANHNTRQKDSLGEDILHHKGEVWGYKEWHADNAAKELLDPACVIKANSLGTTGTVRLRLTFRVSNTGTTSVTSTIVLTLGGTALYSYTTGATSATSARSVLVTLELVITNAGAENAQVTDLLYWEGDALSDGGAVVGSAWGKRLKTATEHTNVDATLSITQQLSTATNSKFERLSVEMLGPYYGA